jgi:hypothetical protein
MDPASPASLAADRVDAAMHQLRYALTQLRADPRYRDPIERADDDLNNIYHNLWRLMMRCDSLRLDLVYLEE